MTDKNPFGGGNPHSLYVPMSEDEQEVLHRLVASQQLQVIIHGWGRIDNPQVVVGDARIAILIDVTFSKPDPPVPVTVFDLELRTQAGMTLSRSQQLLSGGQPMLIGKDIHLVWAWDIMIHHLDPKLVKMLKPGAIGLTSRRIDKDTGEASFLGNMKTTPLQRKLLGHIAEGEAKVQGVHTQEVLKGALEDGHQVKQTSKGLVMKEQV